MKNIGIKIETGSLEIPIQRDGKAQGSFFMNVKDISFVRKVYNMLQKADGTIRNYELKHQVLSKKKEKDKWGFPANLGEIIELNEKTADAFVASIDETFGEGVSDMLFGNQKDIELFVSFFKQIKKIMDGERKKSVNKYIDDIDNENKDHAVENDKLE